MSLRHGNHATVYEVRRDPSLKNKDVIRDKTKRVFPFVSGSKYKGEWSNDQKEGFGVQLNPDDTKYEGEWQEGKYHGRGTLWVKKGKSYARTYVGDWDRGVRSGQGVFYYPDNSVYRGDWESNRKNGQGRFEHPNGDVYVGEWSDDRENGFGTLSFANGNVYEGLWTNGKKEGPGVYFYASTRKVMLPVFFILEHNRMLTVLFCVVCRSTKENGTTTNRDAVSSAPQQKQRRSASTEHYPRGYSSMILLFLRWVSPPRKKFLILPLRRFVRRRWAAHQTHVD